MDCLPPLMWHVFCTREEEEEEAPKATSDLSIQAKTVLHFLFVKFSVVGPIDGYIVPLFHYMTSVELQKH